MSFYIELEKTCFFTILYILWFIFQTRRWFFNRPKMDKMLWRFSFFNTYKIKNSRYYGHKNLLPLPFFLYKLNHFLMMILMIMLYIGYEDNYKLCPYIISYHIGTIILTLSQSTLCFMIHPLVLIYQFISILMILSFENFYMISIIFEFMRYFCY